jgi:hypothetical protein
MRNSRKGHYTKFEQQRIPSPGAFSAAAINFSIDAQEKGKLLYSDNRRYGLCGLVKRGSQTPPLVYHRPGRQVKKQASALHAWRRGDDSEYACFTLDAFGSHFSS